MNKMFNGCSQLQSLTLTTFNKSLVISVSYMFKGCNQLKSIDI